MGQNVCKARFDEGTADFPNFITLFDVGRDENQGNGSNQDYL